MIKQFTLLSIFFMSFSAHVQGQQIDQDEFDIRVVASKLSDPWEVAYGPDKQLWITESKGYRVLKINPADGKKTVVLDLTSQRKFPRYDKIADEKDGGKPWPQGGLMGMALHPMLLKGKPYVFLAYAYQYEGANDQGDGARPGRQGYKYLIRIVRYDYNQRNARLTSPKIVCDTIPGSNDHNGGRLVIGTLDDQNEYVFYSSGDMGAGQFTNGGRTNKAQNKWSYEGKILRFNTVPDSDVGQSDKWIPNDNPFNGDRQNAVWSVGHRNPQGLAFANIGGKSLLYSSEHGPYSDDEINLIEKGMNYGHPLVIGYADGNYNGLAASVSDDGTLPGKWHTAYPYINKEEVNKDSIGDSYRDPIKSIEATDHGTLSGIFNNVLAGKQADWKSEAPSSIEVYTSNAIPGWKNSLLIPTLKGAKLLRIKLSADGKVVKEQIFNYAKGKVRYRDLAISADGQKIYLAVDSSSVSSGPSKEDPKEVSYRGSILELTFKNKHKEQARKEEE